MLLEQLDAGAAHDAAKDEGDDDRVVELAGDRDEVGDEVDRHEEVRDERAEEQLVPARHTPVREQALEEDHAVGNEPGERTRVLAASENDEGEDEAAVQDDHSKEDEPELPHRPHDAAARRLTLSVRSRSVPFQLGSRGFTSEAYVRPIRHALTLLAVLLAAAAVSEAAAAWPTYGNGAARTGYTARGPLAEHVRPLWTANVAGRVTAQPLVVDRTVYVVTTAGRVYAFTSAGRVRWTTDLGSLVHACRQLDRYGITATPVADPRRGVLYVGDAFGRLHALDLATGRERDGWPLQVFRWHLHDHIWGALTLIGDNVYVAAGAYCDMVMEGKLARVSVSTGEIETWVAVPLGLGGGGGIWGWGGAAYSSARRSLYVVTGNAFMGGENTGDAFREFAGYGEHLVELTPELAVRGSSHPADIVERHDLDFSGSPVVFERDGCGELVAAANKNGRLYLWRSFAVAGGPIDSLTIRRVLPSRPLLTQLAYSPRLRSLYVVTNVSLVRIAVDDACRLRIVWSIPLHTRSLNGSPTVAGDVVWFATSGGAPRLHAVDARSGGFRARLALGSLTLVAPTIVGSQIYVGSFFGRVYAFGRE